MDRPVFPPIVDHTDSAALDAGPCWHEECGHLAPWHAELGVYMCFEHYERYIAAQRAAETPAGQPAVKLTQF